MAISAALNILTGILTVLKDSAGFQIAWIAGLPGVTLTMGSVTGISAFVLGSVVQAPAASQMSVLQKEIQSAGGQPTPEQIQELNHLQKRITTASRWEAILMIITVFGMAIAREFGNL